MKQDHEKMPLQYPSQAQNQLSWATTERNEGQKRRILQTEDKIEHYDTIKTIGKGPFGEVKLVQKKADGLVYALKSLVKSDMRVKEQVAYIPVELDNLASDKTPWVVKLYTTFYDSHFYYMLMEFQPGGDLMTMLTRYEAFSEDVTRFYMAECIAAIGTIHALGFGHGYVIQA